DRCARGGRPAQPRQWDSAWPAHVLGWAGLRPRGPLHECARQSPLQSHDTNLLPAAACDWETRQSGAHGLHAEATHDSQCHDETPNTLVCDGCSEYLTLKTVAPARGEGMRLFLRFVIRKSYGYTSKTLKGEGRGTEN